MSATLSIVLLLFPLLQGDAEEQLRYLAGLASKNVPAELEREAQAFLREHPRHPRADEARYRLACAHFDLRRPAEAAALLRPLAKLADFELLSEANFRLGQCELDLGRPAEAAAAFARTLALGKAYLELPARALLGDALLAAGSLDDAKRNFALLLERAPASEYAADAACGLLWCASRQRDHAAVVALAARFQQDFPRHARAGEVQFLRAESLFEQGEEEAALAAYGQVTGESFADAALRGAGFALARLGRHADAARAFGTLVERHPQSRFVGEARLQCAVAKLQAGDARGALAGLPADSLGASGEGAYWRARALAATGAADEALELAERAARGAQDPGQASRWASLRADLLAAAGRADEARAAYEASDSDYALQAGAVASLEAGRPEDALRLARRLLERNPRTAYRQEALLAAAEALFALDRHADAEQAFLAAAEGDRDAERRDRSRLRAAWCRYLRADFPRATAMFRELARTLQAGPAADEASYDEACYDEACYMVARASEDAGDVRAARGAYEEYLARFPRGERRAEALLAGARLSDGPEAMARLAAALSQAGSDRGALEARFELGERLSKAGDFAAAEPHYRQILAAEAPAGLASSARYGLAWCQFSTGRFPEAEATLEALADAAERGEDGVPPELAPAALELAVWAGARAGHVEAALERWRALAARAPGEARLWNSARTLLAELPGPAHASRRAELLESCARAAETPATLGEIDARRALEALERGDRPQSLALLDRAWRAAPNAAGVREAACTIGEASLAADDRESGEGILRALARDEEAPRADRAVYRLGHWRLANGDAQGAAALLARFAQRFPQSGLATPARFLEAEAHFRAGDDARALVAFEELASRELSPELAPKVLFRAGLLHCRAARWRDGEAELAHLSATFPKFENGPEARLWLARARAALGDAAFARATFEALAQSDKGRIGAEARLSLGELALASGDAQSALSAFLKVAVLFSDVELVAASNWGAGRAFEALGRPDEAAASYRELSAKAPQSPLAARARERLDALAAR